MADKPETRGCPNIAVHAEHVWKAAIRVRRLSKGGGTEPRWCPGRVKCDRCGKNVFITTATTVGGNVWVCTGRCR